ncbi:variable surface protein [Plasmodium gonderi]|uniref:Variable surface protein n=1 Tax=Plasmodium gonderi TaxID=77519 RepID=A0A1Y1JWC5_PLAGO|nr:variable surface protein [Plasmodium gonderi]GAW84643.1 variable surface protein [Plasmodium gonderi]
MICQETTIRNLSEYYKLCFTKCIMATVSYFTSDGDNHYDFDKCLEEYINYLDKGKEQIHDFEAKTYTNYCTEWEKLCKYIKHKREGLNECYIKYHMPYNGDGEETINHFIGKYSNTSECSFSRVSLVKDNSKLISETQHNEDRKQEKLGEGLLEKEFEMLQVQKDINHPSSSDSQDEDRKSTDSHTFSTPLELETLCKSESCTDPSTCTALGTQASETVLQKIHNDGCVIHIKHQKKILHECSIKGNVSVSEHAAEKTVEMQEVKVQPPDTKSNEVTFLANGTNDTEEYDGGSLSPVSIRDKDDKNVEHVNQVNLNACIDAASGGSLSSSHVTYSYKDARGLNSERESTHDTFSGVETPVILEHNTFTPMKKLMINKKRRKGKQMSEKLQRVQLGPSLERDTLILFANSHFEY